MNYFTTLFRAMLLTFFFGLIAACGGSEKGGTSENADHGHTHE